MAKENIEIIFGKGLKKQRSPAERYGWGRAPESASEAYVDFTNGNSFGVIWGF